MQPTVLIVEDDNTVSTALSALLKARGIEVQCYSQAEILVQAVPQTNCRLILSDLDLPGMNGLDLLKTLKEKGSRVPFVLMSSRADVPIAVEAMRRGAWDVLSKPLNEDRLNELISQLPIQAALDRALISSNGFMQRVMNLAEKVARTDTSVLVLGESGVGKEVLARKIHRWSKRAEEPFIAINCAAIPETLLESEFFGHEAGAFTGAQKQRMGVLEQATKGTIFLDEIGDMPLTFQVKLLRALQVKEIRRLGGTKTIIINPRVLAATNKNPKELLESKRWREDFYFRVAVVTLQIPPLRERIEDFDGFTDSILGDLGQRFNFSVSLTPEARQRLRGYAWPGNIRELENVLERAAIFSGGAVDVAHLDERVTKSNETTALKDVAQRATKTAERTAVQQAMEQAGYNKSKAARILGVSYKTLLSKVKEYQLQNPETKALETTPDKRVA